MRVLARFGFVIAIGVAGLHAQQPPELPRPAGVPTNAEIRAKLESSQSAEQAWGAWWAAQLQVTELAPEIERVAVHANGAVTSAALDALVQLNAKTSAAFARSMYGNWPVQALILLSRGGPDADPVLVDLVGSEHGYRWLTAVNLGVLRRSAGLAAALLGRLDIPALVFVSDTGSETFLAGGGIGGMVADGGVGLLPGFPPLVHYTFSGGARSGTAVLASGPRTVYYLRTPGRAGETEPAFWSDEHDTQRPTDILAALRGLLRAPFDLHIRVPETKTLRWIDQERLDRDVDEFRADISARYGLLAEWLMNERLLTRTEAAGVTPPDIYMRIEDKRQGAAAPPVTRLSDVVSATLTIPGSADFLAGDAEGVWITNRGRMEKLRRDKPAPVATVQVPRPCGAPALTYDAVWVANCSDQSLYRIDRKTNTVVATIPTGLADRRGELSVAASQDAIWLLTDAAGVLSRIDPRTNTVIAQIEVAPNSYAAAFDYNSNSLWVTNTGARGAKGPGTVQRIDPATNRVVATVPVGSQPRFLSAGHGFVWTLNQGDGTVSRIDPKTNQVVATIDAGVPGTGGDIDASGSGVWVRASRTLLQQIDPSTNKVVAIFGPPAGSGAVRAVGDHVWVSAHDVQKVWVIGVR